VYQTFIIEPTDAIYRVKCTW